VLDAAKLVLNCKSLLADVSGAMLSFLSYIFSGFFQSMHLFCLCTEVSKHSAQFLQHVP
jgi:hypothetical protein